jgi:MscS family membrane protein
MEEFFNKEYYGNNVGEWALSFGVLIAFILLSKVAYILLTKFIKQFTKKTKSKIDDLILDKLEEPAVFAIILVGIWYSLKILELPEWWDKLTSHAFYFLVTFNVAWLLVRLFNALIDEYLKPYVQKTETDFDDQMLPIARKSINVSVWVMAVIIGLNNAGYDVTALIAGLGIGSFAFAMAAKDSISHIFGGFVLFTDKPFTINDRVQVKGYDGFVREVGIRSTRIQTLDGRMVTIPNGSIVNDSVINITAENARKVSQDLGLTYDTSVSKMEQAMKLLKEICVDNENVDESRTVTSFLSFGDFSLNIRFIYYIKKGSDVFQTMNDVNMEILKRFNENKLDFAFPTQTIQTELLK